MLKVKTYVKQSTVPGIGLGLFAGEDIQSGTIIWELNPLIDRTISVAATREFTLLELEFLKKYAYREGNTLILCSDDGRYINHSYEPNVDDIINPDGASISLANQYIPRGTELFCNYSTFDDDCRNGIDFS